MHVNDILSEVTIFNKYSKYLPEASRRESWEELCWRNAEMHIRKYPELQQDIIETYNDFVIPKKVLPSMRSLQFGGRPIELAHNRIYNCAFAPCDDPAIFSEAMFLLLGGTGFGYSVQSHHTNRLPAVVGCRSPERRFLVGDSIEGWADAVKVLVEAYFLGKARPVFDYRDVREKGAALITTGGKAPGPAPLKKCIDHLETMLIAHVGKKLKPINVHDMMCMIADAVLAGGIRRAAMIALFDRWDTLMLNCKAGSFWDEHPYRERANNSAVLPRDEVTEEEFKAIVKTIEASGNGEPGVYWTNNKDWGTNPCCEIALKPFQFCNLTEISYSKIEEQVDFNLASAAAAFIGTLQAGYTDFHYLRPIWKETTEEDALIGVGATGIANGKVFDQDQAAHWAVLANRATAARIGINPAARNTTVKPAGTSSCVLGESSGIHAWHAEYYIRRIRGEWSDALTQYLLDTNPSMVQPEERGTGVVIEFPQQAPEGAVLRSESIEHFLARVALWNREWVHSGHCEGDNKNNVSCTVSVKEGEWDYLAQWMWENKEYYNGISVLPYDGGTYVQAPFEDITQSEFEKRVAQLSPINLLDVTETENNTNLIAEAACSGGACDNELQSSI